MGRTAFFPGGESENKRAELRLALEVIIGGFGGKFALVHFRGLYLAVDLEDILSTNRLLEVIGCDGELRLHLPRTKSPIRYLVGSKTLIFLSKMRNGIPNRGKTTWPNTDTRLNSNEFY